MKTTISAAALAFALLGGMPGHALGQEVKLSQKAKILEATCRDIWDKIGKLRDADGTNPPRGQRGSYHGSNTQDIMDEECVGKDGLKYLEKVIEDSYKTLQDERATAAHREEVSKIMVKAIEAQTLSATLEVAEMLMESPRYKDLPQVKELETKLTGDFWDGGSKMRITEYIFEIVSTFSEFRDMSHIDCYRARGGGGYSGWWKIEGEGYSCPDLFFDLNGSTSESISCRAVDFDLSKLKEFPYEGCPIETGKSDLGELYISNCPALVDIIVEQAKRYQPNFTKGEFVFCVEESKNSNK
ncbi:MAG: hypothetical protein LBO78_03810 [Rickettsiales bacterium]|nr:hypothetical protein [Rickettsiales bacterium]